MKTIFKSLRYFIVIFVIGLAVTVFKAPVFFGVMFITAAALKLVFGWSIIGWGAGLIMDLFKKKVEIIKPGEA